MVSGTIQMGWANYVSFCISVLFLMIFLNMCMVRQFSRRVTAIALAVCGIGTVFFEHFDKMGDTSMYNGLVFLFVETVWVGAFVLILSSHKDFRSIFMTLSGVLFVMVGETTYLIACLITESGTPGLITQILTDFTVLICVWISVGRDLTRINTLRGPGWALLCVIPCCFYVLTKLLTVKLTTLDGNGLLVHAIMLELVLIIVIYIVFIRLAAKRSRLFDEKQSVQYMELFTERLKKEEESVLESAKQTAIIRHDIRHHNRMILHFLETGELDKIRELVGGLDAKLENAKAVRYCENIPVNCVVAEVVRMARAAEVDMQIDLHVPFNTGLNEYEFATVVSNILENAVQAAGKVTPKEKRVVIAKTKQLNNQLIFEVANTFAEELVISEETGLPKSRQKGPLHGFGMKSIQTFAEKNGVIFDYSTEEDMFYTRLLVHIM